MKSSQQPPLRPLIGAPAFSLPTSPAAPFSRQIFISLSALRHKFHTPPPPINLQVKALLETQTGHLPPSVHPSAPLQQIRYHVPHSGIRVNGPPNCETSQNKHTRGFSAVLSDIYHSRGWGRATTSAAVSTSRPSTCETSGAQGSSRRACSMSSVSVMISAQAPLRTTPPVSTAAVSAKA